MDLRSTAANRNERENIFCLFDSVRNKSISLRQVVPVWKFFTFDRINYGVEETHKSVQMQCCIFAEAVERTSVYYPGIHPK